MRLSDCIYNEVTSELPAWVPELWPMMLNASADRVIDVVARSFGEGQDPKVVDTICGAQAAVFTRPIAKALRKRRHAWFFHLLRGDEIILSWCGSRPVGVVPTGVPDAYVQMLKSFGRLSFVSWWSDVLDVDDMQSAEQGIAIDSVIPFFPHGNGDFDVFRVKDQRVLTYNHEYAPEEEGALTEMAASFREWLALRLGQYWKAEGPWRDRKRT